MSDTSDSKGIKEEAEGVRGGQAAGVNYERYGRATDSSSIEVNLLRQIKR